MNLPRFTPLAKYNHLPINLNLHTFDETKTRTPSDILNQFAINHDKIFQTKFHPTQRKIKIAVGSNNKIKVDAAHQGMQQYFHNAALHLTGFTAKSEINEQPIGFEESFRGALNRLQNTKLQIFESGNNDFDYAVAFENGIIHLIGDDGDIFIDVSCVVVEHLRTGARAYIVSGGLEFPSEDVLLTKNLPGSFTSNTVGSQIAKRIGCSPNDPQHYLLRGLLRRQDILAQALYYALVEFAAF